MSWGMTLQTIENISGFKAQWLCIRKVTGVEWGTWTGETGEDTVHCESLGSVDRVVEKRKGAEENWTYSCARWGKKGSSGSLAWISGCAIHWEMACPVVCYGEGCKNLWFGHTSFSPINSCFKITRDTCRWGNITPFCSKWTEVRRSVLSAQGVLRQAEPWKMG